MTLNDRNMLKLWAAGLAATALILAGCATTKTVSVDSDPPGARIYKGADYLGDAPLSVELKEARGFSSKELYVMKATKKGYVSSTKLINKKEIPSRLFFELDKAPVRPALGSGGSQQQMSPQQQMQGPTIVIPGSGGQPVEVRPGGAK